MTAKIKLSTEITGSQPCIAVWFKDPVIPVNTKLLDQSGFPWLVAHMDQKVGYLSPLRGDGPVPTEVASLRPYETGLKEALLTRVCTYVASIEALDVEVDTVYITPDIDIPPDPFKNVRGEGPKLVVLTDPHNVPTHSVLIQDKRGVLWGYLPALPERAPAEWPFPGKVIGKGNKTVELHPNGRGTFLVTDGTISVSTDVFLAFEVASTLLEKGWSEAVRTHFSDKHAMLVPGKCSSSSPR